MAPPTTCSIFKDINKQPKYVKQLKSLLLPFSLLFIQRLITQLKDSHKPFIISQESAMATSKEKEFNTKLL